MEKNPYIWYASYGSNVSRERFLCYIKGGIPPGSARKERGCRDKSLPLKDEPQKILYPLYFAAYSNRWGGGVAFIGHKKIRVSDPSKTLGRRYLIKEKQFRDIIAQENNRPGITRESIDYDDIVKKGLKVVFSSLYGGLVYLGKEQGYPVFTFTSGQELSPATAPSRKYLKTLMIGLGESHSLIPEEMATYFKEKPGIQGYYTREELLKIARERG